MTPEVPEIDYAGEPDQQHTLKTGEAKTVPTGRRRADIDPEVVMKLARLHCTTTEIADWFKVNEATIRRRFGDVIKQCQQETRARLRQAQLKAALDGNVTMLIFLGKVILGQREDAGGDIEKILPWKDD